MSEIKEMCISDDGTTSIVLDNGVTWSTCTSDLNPDELWGWLSIPNDMHQIDRLNAHLSLLPAGSEYVCDEGDGPKGFVTSHWIVPAVRDQLIPMEN